MLSLRSKNISPQPMFEILQLAKNYEAQGKKIIHLEIGDSSTFENNQMLNLIKKNISKKKSLEYSPSEGEYKLREAFIFHYNNLCKYKFEIENIVVTPANAGITQLINVLTDKSDSVLIPDPGFPTYYLSCKFNNVKPYYYLLNQDNNFQIDVDAIKKIIQLRKIKILIINNPSNPLGLFHVVSDINKLIIYCNNLNVNVIIDDTYRNLIYFDNYPRIIHKKNVFYIYSLSKDTASPAMRIGCIIGEKRIIKKISEHNSLFYSCLPKFLQLAAADYLMQDHRPYRRYLRESMLKRINNLHSIFIKSKGITYIKPNAGIYFYLNISKTNLDGDNFSKKLLDSTGVCVCPGKYFGPSGKSYVRICISGNEKKLYLGAKKLVNFFNSVIGSLS